jgi:hypothetical protein
MALRETPQPVVQMEGLKSEVQAESSGSSSSCAPQGRIKDETIFRWAGSAVVFRGTPVSGGGQQNYGRARLYAIKGDASFCSNISHTVEPRSTPPVARRDHCLLEVSMPPRGDILYVITEKCDHVLSSPIFPTRHLGTLPSAALIEL